MDDFLKQQGLPIGYLKCHFTLMEKLSEDLDEFFIITAWNPMDKDPGITANKQADERLRSMLEKLNLPHFRVISSAKDGVNHREEGWCVICPLAPVLSLARQFHQRALWRVVKNQLLLIECKTEYSIKVSAFSERLLSKNR